MSIYSCVSFLFFVVYVVPVIMYIFVSLNIKYKYNYEKSFIYEPMCSDSIRSFFHRVLKANALKSKKT